MFMYTRRCFAHVDQALFAVERHCEHTIVFDCGGEDQSIVNKAIDEVLSDEEIIDILFVSHYDSDHINGIQPHACASMRVCPKVSKCEVDTTVLDAL